MLQAHAKSHTSQRACHLSSKATIHPEEACRNLPNLRFFSSKNASAHPQAAPSPLHWLPTSFQGRGLFPGGFSQLPSQSVSEGDEQAPHVASSYYRVRRAVTVRIRLLQSSHLCQSWKYLLPHPALPQGTPLYSQTLLRFPDPRTAGS